MATVPDAEVLVIWNSPFRFLGVVRGLSSDAFRDYSKRGRRESPSLFIAYSKGLTTEQIGEISQEIYGRYYSKQQVSFLARGCKSEIDAWLLRSLSPRYLVVYIDATYVSTRREERVHQEAYYTMLGVLPNGTREVLGVVNHPSEGALNWKNELIALQERGVEQIDLIVSDALTGVETAVAEAFPSAEHQFCITHLKRSMSICVASKDKGELLRDLEEIFPVEQKGYSMVGQFEKFRIFVARWSRRYPSFRRFDAPRNVAYFSYLNYPPQFHRMIYTTNWIERLNRFYKRTLKMRGALPSAEAVLFLMGRVAPGRKPKPPMQERCLFSRIGMLSESTTKIISKGKVVTRNSILGYYPYTLFRTLPFFLVKKYALKLCGKRLMGSGRLLYKNFHTFCKESMEVLCEERLRAESFLRELSADYRVTVILVVTTLPILSRKETI